MKKNVYSNNKLFNFPDKLNSIKEGSITAPIHMRIKPTNRCNHKCWYCGYQNDDANITLGDGVKQSDVIPKEKMIEICNDIVNMGVKAVTFSGGGEPLMYPHILNAVNILLDGGIKIAFITNGSLLKGEVAKTLANRASWIRISMDGWNDDSYREYRGVKTDEYSKIAKNIEEFAKIKGSTTLGISYNVDEKNYSHINQFSKNMKNIGIDHIKFSGTVVSNFGAENNEYHKPFFDETVKIIEDTKKELEDDNFSIINLYHELPELFDKTYTSCPFLHFLTVIGADLNVYSCQDKAYTDSGTIGNIKDMSFKDFWYSKECKSWIDNLDPSVSCKHHCVADAKNKMILNFLNLKSDHLEFV